MWQKRLDPEDVVHRVLEAAQIVQRALGPGFIESIYVRALRAELKNADFRVEQEKLIKIGMDRCWWVNTSWTSSWTMRWSSK
jgi:hypothetical protein